MNLVIAEKPSVAQAIAKVLHCSGRQDGYQEGNGYIVSWCVGHLVELAQPEIYDNKYEKWRKEDLPICPGENGIDWKYQVSAATKKQFQILQELMKREDVDCVTNACDAGREGELIFRLVYDMCGCKKQMKRLWISSMEDEAIKNGFENLKNGGEYDKLYDAALCRERADWLIGINGTRLFSTMYGQTLNVGRVMTPTLALAVERENAIKDFTPEIFYILAVKCDGVTLGSERIKSKEEAIRLAEKLKECRKIQITKVEKKENKEKAPALFDLTSLQREANRKLGYTAQQTLDYAQNLYEKKIISYPRTDSRYLTEDMRSNLSALVDKVQDIFSMKTTESKNYQAVINGAKVTDHHAIIPTASIDKVDLSALPIGEREILKLIAIRLLEAVSLASTFSETVVEVAFENHLLKAKGKQVIEAGWKGIDPLKTDRKESEDKDEVIGSMISENDELEIVLVECREGKTTPAKSFTEDTLLSAMEKAGSDEIPDESERKGLGTPATRAGIIEKLVRVGFIERKGDKKTKYLVPTHKGEAVIRIVPEEIQSASMTADWEQKLLEIEKGKYSSEQFMEEIEKLVTDLVNTYELIPDAEVLMKPAYESIGKCPCCGKDVVEKSKGFFCSDNDCKFALWKENRLFDSMSKKMTKQVAEQFLKNGKTKMKKCRSIKTGKTYDCTVVMAVDESGKVQFSLEFDNTRKVER